MSEEKIDYVLRAIEFVAAKGVLFLPYYRCVTLPGLLDHIAAMTMTFVGLMY